MRKFLLAAIVSTLAVTGPLHADPGAIAAATPLFADSSCGAPAMSSSLFAAPASGELALPLTSPEAQTAACLQRQGGAAAAGCQPTSICEYRSGGCRNEPGGWCTTWKYKWCMNDCCQWSRTSETCCYTTQPNCSC